MDPTQPAGNPGPEIDLRPALPPTAPRARLSCVACQQKKVKCDRIFPCATCRRLRIACIPSKRNPYSSRGLKARAKQVEIQCRLEKLELEIMTMHASQSSLGEAQGSAQPASAERQSRTVVHTHQPVDKTLAHSFWKGLCDQFKELKCLLKDESEEDACPTEDLGSDLWEPEIIFDFDDQPSGSDATLIHPSADDIYAFLGIYFANIDPVFKVLHRPSVEQLVKSALETPDCIHSGAECLLFSIYFAAAISLTNEQCVEKFGAEKRFMIAKFRRQLMRAFKRADLLNTVHVLPLQSLVIFLAVARASDASRFVWTLTSIAVRLGHALGLHRDGNGSLLPPFEAEIRRRLWWQICYLDGRAAEDRGSDYIILDETFDTVMPKNLNDDDFGPNFELKEAHDVTEITYSLMSHELFHAARKLNYASPKLDIQGSTKLSMEDRECLAFQCESSIQSKYLGRLDPSVPFQWMVLNAGRFLIARLWLFVYYPLQPCNYHVFRRSGTQDIILETAMAAMEFEENLEANIELAHWRWMAEVHVSWSVLAVALSELCLRTQGSTVERAWKAVDNRFNKFKTRIADSRKGSLWRPLAKLYDKALAAKQGASQGESRGVQKAPSGIVYQSDALLYKDVSPQEVMQPYLGQLPLGGVHYGEQSSDQQQLFFPISQPLSGLVGPLDVHVADGNDAHEASFNWQDWNTFLGETSCTETTSNDWFSGSPF